MSNNWCQAIDDATKLNQLALPGAHDAAAWTHHSNWPSLIPATWAQRKSIVEQLNLGVRVLDLRVGYASNYLTLGITSFVGMFHGPIYLNITLETVLQEINNWLNDNESEFVILIFQQQGKIGQSDVRKDVINQTKNIFGKDKIYNPKNSMEQWPALSNVRGKVIMFNRMRSYENNDNFFDVRLWLTQGDNTSGTKLNNIQGSLSIYLQDKYKGLSSIGGYKSMEDDNKKKFDYVEKAAKKILEESDENLGINHMNYSNLRYQPWESGQGVNKIFCEKKTKIRGILMIDDADKITVERIISNNFFF